MRGHMCTTYVTVCQFMYVRNVSDACIQKFLSMYLCMRDCMHGYVCISACLLMYVCQRMSSKFVGMRMSDNIFQFVYAVFMSHLSMHVSKRASIKVCQAGMTIIASQCVHANVCMPMGLYQ